MPEYGRGVQQMVNHALTIEDREERQRCARTIIRVMGGMFPYLRDSAEFKHKLWNHLAMMSGYRLDIDYPYEIVQKRDDRGKVERPKYYSSHIRYRHYGRMVLEMIASAVEMEAGEERDAFALAIANQMKRLFMVWNKEQVDNARITSDLLELSEGKLVVDPDKLAVMSGVHARRENGNGGGTGSGNGNGRRRRRNNNNNNRGNNNGKQG